MNDALGDHHTGYLERVSIDLMVGNRIKSAEVIAERDGRTGPTRGRRR
jgi:hypothetical protein